MVKSQKSCISEFKQQIVELHNAGGTSYPQLEHEYGVNRNTLNNWVKQPFLTKILEEETATLKEYKALRGEIRHPEIENEILKKSDCHTRKRTIAGVVTSIQNHLNHYTVSQLCGALEFLRNTYYKALVRVPSNRQEEYGEFGRKVKQTYDEPRQGYGAVRICRTLNNNGTLYGVKRVQRHMEQQGLRSVIAKKYNHHINRGAIPDDKANILKRDSMARTINQKWCTDITYTHVLKGGWTYLASVMDPCSRKTIEYAYGTPITTKLVVEAVENVCLNVRNAQGILLHNDLGGQYTSQVFEVYPDSKGTPHLLSRKGNPYGNACIEPPHSVLKKEEIYPHTYQGSQETRRAIFEYIKGWHDRRGIHSAIGYMASQQEEDEELEKSA